MAQARDMGAHLGALALKVEDKISYLRDALAEYRDIRTVIDGITKEKEMLQQEKERLQHQQHVTGEAFAAMKEDLLASKNTLEEARDALVATTEEITRKNTEVEFLKKKLQENQAKNNQVEQQCGSAAEPIQPGGVQTRSMQKRKRPSEVSLGYGAYENECTSLLDDQSPSCLEFTENHDVQTRLVEKHNRPTERCMGNDADKLEMLEECTRQELVNKPTVGQTTGVLVSNDDELEAVRHELIKGFLEIDAGGRKLGIKEMGDLNQKAFKAACLAKLPPDEVGAGYCRLYSSWQSQLSDLGWKPFKTVTVDGNCQEIVNVDDDKLQELKRTWGEGAHNAVVSTLMEMKEYHRLGDRSISYELWNYKEGREATVREGVEYKCSQVKQLSAAKRRKSRRAAGRVAGIA